MFFFIFILFLLVGLLLYNIVISLYILIKIFRLVSTMFESTIGCIRMGGCPFPHNLNSFGQYLPSFLSHFLYAHMQIGICGINSGGKKTGRTNTKLPDSI